MYYLQKIKEQIRSQISNAIGVTLEPGVLENPPQPDYGDLSLPCFKYANELKKKPEEIAQTLVDNFKPLDFIESVKATGPYFNIILKKDIFVLETLDEILKEKEKYGQLDNQKDKKINLEYLSPNTNKPLTIGHLRNLCLGWVVGNLYQNTGAKVIRTRLYNNRGIAITKSMLAYDHFGKKTTPENEGVKPDHFVGQYYVLFNQKAKEQPKLEIAAQEMLILWEKGNKEVVDLWKKMNNWFYQGVNQTLKKLKMDKFDKNYYESDFYDKGKEIVEQGLKKGLFKTDNEGAICADLSKFDLENKVLLRPDGTSLYITQDLYLFELKQQENADEYIMVVADEQNLQMKQLFAILKILGKKTEKFKHLSYGLMRLPEGKIKSREGAQVALADTLIEELETLAKKEILERSPDLKEKEVSKRAEIISLAALKFYILLVNPQKLMVFNPKESLSFNGKTGPYILYTLARLKSILKTAKIKTVPKLKPESLPAVSDIENDLIMHLSQYPEIINRSLKNLDPSELAQYLYNLTEMTNSFYHQEQVLKATEKEKNFRLNLIKAIILVIENSLNLLGIESLEQM